MSYLKHFLIVCCFFIFSETQAATVKVDFAVKITDKDELNLETQKYTHIHYPNPIQGKFAISYDNSRIHHVFSENTHTYVLEVLQWTADIKSVLSDSGGSPFTSLSQRETANSGEFDSSFNFASANHPPGVFMPPSQPLLTGALGVENFFNSALAQGHEFGFRYDNNFDIWKGNAVITEVTAVPLPGASWFLGSGALLLAVLMQFRSRRQVYLTAG